MVSYDPSVTPGRHSVTVQRLLTDHHSKFNAAVMVVKLQGHVMVLKLHDCRFSPAVRRDYGLRPWAPEREERLVEYLTDESKSPSIAPLIQRVWELRLPLGDDGQVEAWLGVHCNLRAESETDAYRTLEPMQRRGALPTLLGAVAFVTRSGMGDLEEYFTVPGVLLAHVPCVDLAPAAGAGARVPILPADGRAMVAVTAEMEARGVVPGSARRADFGVRPRERGVRALQARELRALGDDVAGGLGAEAAGARGRPAGPASGRARRQRGHVSARAEGADIAGDFGFG